MAQPVDLVSLLACCAIASMGASRIIRDVGGSGDIEAADKKAGGPDALRDLENMDPSAVVTIADRRAQDHICNSLHQKFPLLRIVGEEGDVPPGADVTGFSEEVIAEWVQALPSPTVAALRALNPEALTYDSVCVWVDPLDGTKEFACKRGECCAVLIGITVDALPFAGVMTEPYRKAPDGSLGVPTIGVVGVGLVRQSPAPLLPRPAGAPVICCSAKDKPVVKATLDALATDHPDLHPLRTGGCGNKILRVLEGTADAFLQGPGCCRWDTCAGEALLRATGGVLTDLNGDALPYCPTGPMENDLGILAARDADTHARLLRASKGRLPA